MSELRYGRFGGERERSYRATNFDYFDPWRVAGDYEMPVISRCDVVPERLIGFNYAKTARDTDCGVHFFIDDYQFERIWRNPRQSIPPLARFQCVLTPDFSLYTDMPMAMKIWNTYRSRMIGQIMQREDGAERFVTSSSGALPRITYTKVKRSSGRIQGKII